MLEVYRDERTAPAQSKTPALRPKLRSWTGRIWRATPSSFQLMLKLDASLSVSEIEDADLRAALSPHVAVRLVERMRRPTSESVLTTRETEVLRLVATGHSNKQIGARLGIGEATVKTHLLKTFDKLGVADRTHAVTTAMERGILP